MTQEREKVRIESGESRREKGRVVARGRKMRLEKRRIMAREKKEVKGDVMREEKN